MCPTLGTTTSAENGLGMGVATMVVLILSNIVISLIKNIIPDKGAHSGLHRGDRFVRDCYPDADAGLRAGVVRHVGRLHPLIVVNCIILERRGLRLETMPSIRSWTAWHRSGFTLALTVIGTIREILGSGAMFSYSLGTADYMPLVRAGARRIPRAGVSWSYLTN